MPKCQYFDRIRNRYFRSHKATINPTGNSIGRGRIRPHGQIFASVKAPCSTLDIVIPYRMRQQTPYQNTKQSICCNDPREYGMAQLTFNVIQIIDNDTSFSNLKSTAMLLQKQVMASEAKWTVLKLLKSHVGQISARRKEYWIASSLRTGGLPG